MRPPLRLIIVHVGAPVHELDIANPITARILVHMMGMSVVMPIDSLAPKVNQCKPRVRFQVPTNQAAKSALLPTRPSAHRQFPPSVLVTTGSHLDKTPLVAS